MNFSMLQKIAHFYISNSLHFIGSFHFLTHFLSLSRKICPSYGTLQRFYTPLNPNRPHQSPNFHIPLKTVPNSSKPLPNCMRTTYQSVTNHSTIISRRKLIRTILFLQNSPKQSPITWIPVYQHAIH